MRKTKWYRMMTLFSGLLLASCLFAGSVFASETIDTETVRQVQEALNAAGYDCGTPDGVAGQKTAGAVSAWQTDNGLDVTGVIDDALLAGLGLPAEVEEESTDETAENPSPEQAEQAPVDRTGSEMVDIADDSGEVGLSMYVPRGMTVSDESSKDKAVFTDEALKPFTGTWEVAVFRDEPGEGGLEDFLFRSMDDFYSFYKVEMEKDDDEIQQMFRENVRELDVNGTRVLWDTGFVDYWEVEFYAAFALPTGSAVSIYACYESPDSSELFLTDEEIIPKLLHEVVDCCISGLSDTGDRASVDTQKQEEKSEEGQEEKQTAEPKES